MHGVLSITGYYVGMIIDLKVRPSALERKIMLENIGEWGLPLIQQYALQYPIIMTIVVIMGSARVIMKPLMKLLEAIASITKSNKDNIFLVKLKKNKIYQGFVWFLDYGASVKLPKK